MVHCLPSANWTVEYAGLDDANLCILNTGMMESVTTTSYCYLICNLFSVSGDSLIAAALVLVAVM
jgi:hypothetical protein